MSTKKPSEIDWTSTSLRSDQNGEKSTAAPNNQSEGMLDGHSNQVKLSANQVENPDNQVDQKEAAVSTAYVYRVQTMSQDISVAARARRECIAREIMVTLAAGTRFMVGPDGRIEISPEPTGSAFVACYLADALIARLDAPPQPESTK